VESSAVVLNGPKDLEVGALKLTEPGPADLVVDITHSGISTGTEKLFWSGEMPPFPGMGMTARLACSAARPAGL